MIRGVPGRRSGKRFKPSPRSWATAQIHALLGVDVHIRNSRPVAAGERIAFVWVHTRGPSEKDPFLQRVFLGAKARAETLGYGLEQFWTGERRGMTDRRLSQVMKSRGIVDPAVTGHARGGGDAGPRLAVFCAGGDRERAVESEPTTPGVVAG